MGQTSEANTTSTQRGASIPTSLSTTVLQYYIVRILYETGDSKSGFKFCTNLEWLLSTGESHDGNVVSKNQRSLQSLNLALDLGLRGGILNHSIAVDYKR